MQNKHLSYIWNKHNKNFIIASQDIFPSKTPQTAVIAATTYLLDNQPPVRDPRSVIHKYVIAGLGLVRAALTREDTPDPKKNSTVKFTRNRTLSTDKDDHELWLRSHNYNARYDLTQRKIDKLCTKCVLYWVIRWSNRALWCQMLQPIHSEIKDAQRLQASFRQRKVRRPAGAEDLARRPHLVSQAASLK